MSIIISQNGKNAQKIDKTDIEKENFMQQYIHENPEAIPVYEIEEDKKLFVMIREYRTESGFIDALAIDKDGDIYVVETKLYKNPDKRTVVAQALDYGASLWRHSDYGEFISKINNEVNKKFKISFEEKVKDFFNLSEEEIITLLEAMKRNLRDGNIKFVILMDSVDDRLKDLIVYINQNSQFDIYAIQMEYYKFEKYEIMIPKLFGNEVRKNSIYNSNTRGYKNWTPGEFLNTAKNNLQKNHYLAVEKLFNFSQKNCSDLGFGSGTGNGSINPIFEKISERSFYSLESNGKLKWKIEFGLQKAKDEKSEELLKCLPANFEKIGIKVTLGRGFNIFEIEDWFEQVDDIVEILIEVLK